MKNEWPEHFRAKRAAPGSEWLRSAKELGPILFAFPLAIFTAVFMLGTTDAEPNEAQAATSRASLHSPLMAECGAFGSRINCVVDGDTIWLNGTKIRIADINTPEVSSPGCRAEAQLGARATKRLTQLLNEAPFSLESVDRDEDQYGRKLRVVMRGGESLGDVLVAEGLAERWTGSRRNWC